jgi:agmatine deiminase
MTSGTTPAGPEPPALSRRRLLASSALAASGWAAAGAAAGCAGTAGQPAPEAGRSDGPAIGGVPAGHGWFLPADHRPHVRTWMAWPARPDIWGDQLTGVRADVARIARAIARFEPVSMIARPGQARTAGRACGPGVHIVPMINDDLWMRDTGPIHAQ